MNRKDRTVYIMLTDYPDKVSRTIKRIGLWEYSHMSISTDEHYPKFFSFTGKRGFMTEDFDLHPTYKGTDVPCALFALPVTGGGASQCRAHHKAHDLERRRI